MQYNEHQLAQLAATIAAGMVADKKLLERVPEKDQLRAKARDLAQVSLLVARHILAGAHVAGMKQDELELLYEDADFF
jgi:hypothetical protein